MRRFIDDELSERARIAELLRRDDTLVGVIADVAEASVKALRAGNKILLAGNGGSAGDAQHLAAEFVSRFLFDRPGLTAIALTTDTSALTAISNDYGFEQLFARQLQALGRPGDLFMAFSTSGRSPNVLTGLREARRLRVTTVGFSSQTGGDMNALCDFMFRAPSSNTAHIQELHMSAGHIICGLVEAAMFPQ